MTIPDLESFWSSCIRSRHDKFIKIRGTWHVQGLAPSPGYFTSGKPIHFRPFVGVIAITPFYNDRDGGPPCLSVSFFLGFCISRIAFDQKTLPNPESNGKVDPPNHWDRPRPSRWLKKEPPGSQKNNWRTSWESSSSFCLRLHCWWFRNPAITTWDA